MVYFLNLFFYKKYDILNVKRCKKFVKLGESLEVSFQLILPFIYYNNI